MAWWDTYAMSRPERLLAALVVTLMTTGLGACHRLIPDGHFKSAVHKRIRIGDPRADVEERLSGIRFSCHAMSQDPEGQWITCTRLQEGLLASCIDRANLRVSLDERIEAIDLRKPSCTGF